MKWHLIGVYVLNLPSANIYTHCIPQWHLISVQKSKSQKNIIQSNNFDVKFHFFSIQRTEVVLLSPSELDDQTRMLLKIPLWHSRVCYVRGSVLKDEDLERFNLFHVSSLIISIRGQNYRQPERASFCQLATSKGKSQLTSIPSWGVGLSRISPRTLNNMCRYSGLKQKCTSSMQVISSAQSYLNF